MSKLEEIRERVEDARGVCLPTAEQDRQYLLDLLDEVIKTAKFDFGDFASNIRYNNRENREDWNMRARTYDAAALHLDEVLVRSVNKL
jgi:hypothetical protein